MATSQLCGVLAARYLVQRGIQGEQAFQVLAFNGKIAPQLTGVAAYLVAEDSRLRENADV
jgi:ABC-type spermidine/putrescine transport system permease subunit II